MKREQLEELGLTVHAELIDDKLDDYFFVVEDKTGNMDVLYFYRNSLFDMMMVAVYHISTFKKKERNEMRRRPHEFLEGFYRKMRWNVPDFKMDEGIWKGGVKNEREGLGINTQEKSLQTQL